MKESNEKIKRGVSVIIYDVKPLYFLILHRNSSWTGWEFPKGPLLDGEKIEEALKREIVEKTGLSKINVTHKLEGQRRFRKDDELHVYDVFLARANMNTPVTLSRSKIKYDNYLWTKQDSVLEKLSWSNEKEVFKKALEVLNKKIKN